MDGAASTAVVYLAPTGREASSSAAAPPGDRRGGWAGAGIESGIESGIRKRDATYASVGRASIVGAGIARIRWAGVGCGDARVRALHGKTDPGGLVAHAERLTMPIFGAAGTSLTVAA